MDTVVSWKSDQNKAFRLPHFSGDQASQALSDFKLHNISLPLLQGVAGQVRAQAQWTPPPRDYFKVNFDEAIFPELGKAGLGVVI